MSPFFPQRVFPIFVFFSFFIQISISADSDPPEPNKCSPGTFPTEIISSAGQLFLFCHEAPTCQALTQGAATCSDTRTTACPSTGYVGAIGRQSVSDNGAINYLVQCCQSPAITSSHVIQVTNRVLDRDDSSLEEVREGTLQIISNIYAVEKGKHIIQLSKLICTV